MVIAIIALAVSVFATVAVGMVAVVNARRERARLRRIFGTILSLKELVEERLIKRETDLLAEECKKAAAKEAGLVFAERGKDIVSAEVCNAMKREHVALLATLREELKKVATIQGAKIEGVNETAERTSSAVSRMVALMQKLHLWPREKEEKKSAEPQKPHVAPENG